MTANKPLILFLMSIIIFCSCQSDSKTLSSITLNKADGIYKYKEKPFTGRVLDTTRSGRVLLTFTCVDGKLDGDYLKYFEKTGNLKERVTYQNGTKTGPYKKMTYQGNPYITGEYLNFKRQGEWKKYFNNGRLKSIGYYQNGLQTGLWKYYYYNNGKLKAVGNYENGDMSDEGNTGVPKNGRQGLWKFYYENSGKIKKEAEYINGLLSGKLIGYYENGGIAFKGIFKDGRRHGLLQYFDEKGELENEYYFENDLEIIKKEKR